MRQSILTGGVVNISVPQTPPSSTGETYPLLFVIDGDTIVARRGREEISVRLIGVDAPETGRGSRPEECFGKEAGEHLRDLLGEGPISLLADPTQGTYDKYGRILMYVERGGEDIGARMIADGYANEYTYRTAYARQKTYRDLERSAREGERGLWAQDPCAITIR